MSSKIAGGIRGFLKSSLVAADKRQIRSTKRFINPSLAQTSSGNIDEACFQLFESAHGPPKVVG
jgi:hypothetical protein